MINFPIEVQQNFEKNIIDKVWKPDRVLDYSFFVDILNCSKTDIDCVLRSEIRKGLIKKISSNSYLVLGIARPRIESVFQFASNSGLKPKSIVRKLEIEYAHGDIASKLNISKGSPLFRQVRTRIIDRCIFANQCNLIPFEICPTLDTVDLTNYSFQIALEKKFSTIIFKIDEKYSIIPAIKSDEEILGLSSGDFILRVERLSYSVNNMPVVWADIHVKIEEFSRVKNLWPKALKLIEEFQV